MDVQPPRHADPVDAGAARHACGAPRERRQCGGDAGRPSGRAVDHRNLAWPLLHAACRAPGRRLVAAACSPARSSRSVSAMRPGSRWRAWRGSIERRASSRACRAAPRKCRCWASASARASTASRRRSRMRILIVVLIVPTVFTIAGVHGADRYVPGATLFSAGGFALLMAATAAGGFLALALKLPNAFVLGSLAVAIPLTADGDRSFGDSDTGVECRAVSAGLRARRPLPARLPAGSAAIRGGRHRHRVGRDRGVGGVRLDRCAGCRCCIRGR